LIAGEGASSGGGQAWVGLSSSRHSPHSVSYRGDYQERKYGVLYEISARILTLWGARIKLPAPETLTGVKE